MEDVGPRLRGTSRTAASVGVLAATGERRHVPIFERRRNTAAITPAESKRFAGRLPRLFVISGPLLSLQYLAPGMIPSKDDA